MGDFNYLFIAAFVPILAITYLSLIAIEKTFGRTTACIFGLISAVIIVFYELSGN